MESRDEFQFVSSEMQENIWHLFSLSLDLLCVADLDGRFTYINPAFEKTLGFTKSELLATRFLEFVHPDDRAATLAAMEQLTRGAPVLYFENRYRCKDGSYKWLAWTGFPLVEKGVAYAVARDITEKKSMEEALQKSHAELERRIEERTSDLSRINATLQREIEEHKRTEEALSQLAFIVESAEDAIISYTLDGVVVTWNSGAAKTYGYSAEEIKGRPGFILVPRDHLNQAQEILSRIRAGDHIDHIEIPCITKDGRTIDVSLKVSPVNDAAGNIVGASAIARDITEQRQLVISLQEAELRYRTFFNQAPDGSVIIDPESKRVLDFNEAVCRQLGYSHEEFSRLRISDFEVNETPEATTAHIEEILREGRDDFETRHRTKQGDIRDIQVIAQVIDLSGRRVLRCIFRDITERKKFEEYARHVDRIEALGRFAGGIVHDFNNLLMAISGYTDLSLIELPPGHPLRGNLEQVKSAGERAAVLARKLLTFSRKQELHLEVVDLNGIITNMEKLLRHAVRPDVELVTLLDRAVGQVRVDPGQIEQVITNLVINASDAMPEGGKLTIEAAQTDVAETPVRKPSTVPPGSWVVLSVSDTGTGMSPEVQSHIFEPFFTTKNKEKRTGLGLSIVYGIVKQNGGDIRFNSQLGLGTTFKIFLPRVSS
ncbi:MAG: PAS domain S-box protein [Acidobacteria bacterium]|nr:PAS domain S-box protein [Acidobacteriota bacterium]